MTALRDRLRDETASLHQRLEGRLALLDPSLDLARYVGVLAAMLGLYRPLERRLAYAPVELPRAEKSPWLEQDLASLGLAPEALPECDEVPEVDEAGAIGCHYVLEGATLGGTVIVRHVAARLGLGERGTRFFSGYGADTGARWRETLGAIERWGDEHPDGHDGAVRAACATFLALERWLDAREVLR